ncbi:MAG TPA: helix-turn-helix transcriptional regulator [Caulobacteraceae bacterium]|jgi:transcriptional regulator with XRE-family HTH domain|nr:helix-turn-helix transcriptional regulator [Caulobacteraceae bacterium]
MVEPHHLDIALGLRIRQRRKALGLSQTALAEAVGLTFQQIQKYERGANRVSFSRMVEIAHTLNCRAADLIGDLDDQALPGLLQGQDAGYMRIAGAPELLAAYACITSPLRRAILKLVVALANECGQRQREPRELEPQPH